MAPSTPIAEPRRAVAIDPTPFSIVEDRAGLRVATKELLLPLSHHLEHHAFGTSEPPVLLSAFEDVAHFSPATRQRYRELAGRCALTAALGAGMPETPVDGVRGAALGADDALRGEWVVAVVGPHFAGALIARDLGDVGADHLRRFAFTITYDRETVVRCARSLLAKVVAVTV